MSTTTKTGISIECDVMLPMRDGVALATDVFRPAADGRYPVVLVRTPYGKLASGGPEHLGLVRAGYVVVVQDSRGTGGSQGVFRPMFDEADDGSDTIAWAASQPWSSGDVGMMGGSYLGGTQLRTASAAPPALRAVAPMVSFSEEMLYQGGAFRLGNNLPWSLMMAAPQLDREEAAGRDVSEQRERLDALNADVASALRTLPLIEMTRVTSWLERSYGQWLKPPATDDYWNEAITLDRCKTFKAPAMHLAGWYDVFLNGQLATYQALRDHAATEEARTNQRLVLMPAGHGSPVEALGDVWYGPQATSVNIGFLQREWFDAWLKGRPLEGPRVRLFVSGVNRWRDESDWPLARAVPTRWYLAPGGRLSPQAPSGDAEPDEFRYDPSDPVPTVSGQAVMWGRDGAFANGPRNRRRVQSRDDVLVYMSEPLQHDVEVTGPVTATLHVTTSARDTDFTVTLVDVEPDGRAIGLTDGILRLRYRDGLDKPQLLEPGRVYQIEIDMVATSNVFLAGHRICIEVSSSNFPRFDRNPNHGGVIAEATESDFAIASQRVFHDANRASYVTLPIVAPI